MRTSIVFFILFSFFTNKCNAQWDSLEDFFYAGIKGGITQSNIEEIENTLIPPYIPFQSYNTGNNAKTGFTIGAELMFKAERYVSGGFGLKYYQKNANHNKLKQIDYDADISEVMSFGDFSYSDDSLLLYNVSFNYAFMDIYFFGKFYPFDEKTTFEQFNITVGGGFSPIVKQAIKYRSNDDPAINMLVEENLNRYLDGTFGYICGIWIRGRI